MAGHKPLVLSARKILVENSLVKITYWVAVWGVGRKLSSHPPTWETRTRDLTKTSQAQ